MVSSVNVGMRRLKGSLEIGKGEYSKFRAMVDLDAWSILLSVVAIVDIRKRKFAYMRVMLVSIILVVGVFWRASELIC